MYNKPWGEKKMKLRNIVGGAAGVTMFVLACIAFGSQAVSNLEGALAFSKVNVSHQNPSP